MSNITRTEELLTTPKGPIRLQTITGTAEPHSQLIITHGYAEHLGRYLFMADFFAEKGFQVIVYDLPGHGHTYGPRFNIKNYDQYLEALNTIIAHVQSEEMKQKPLFLFGHSMGGLITTYFLEHAVPNNLKAAAVSGPYLKCSIPLPKIVSVGADLLGRILPTAHIKSTFTGKDVTQNPAIIAEYDNDPLMGRITPFRWFHASNVAQKYTLSHGSQIKTPLLCWAGDSDKLADSQTTEKFVNSLPIDHQFKMLENCYHEVLNEEAYREPGLKAILDWYNKYRA